MSSATKVVAVVGATGLQGGSVVKALHQVGKYKVRALTRNVQSAAAAALKQKYPGIELAELPSDNLDALRKAFRGADIVFGVTRNFTDYDVSTSGSENPEVEHGKNI
ncbi:hypothetical protein LPJ56_006655, partial [Coemansia sp. RSA 2599]